MLSRHTMTTGQSQRASSMRRLRRQTARRRLYCATNGCASFLELDTVTGVAACPICGYRRRLS